MTFVSTDPLVATLFAIECRNHGEAAVLIVSQQKFVVLASEEEESCRGPVDLTYTAKECAVLLAVSPSELEAQADLIVEVEVAIAVLNELGFQEIPLRFGSRAQMGEEITATSNRKVRLSLKQIRDFDEKIRERQE